MYSLIEEIVKDSIWEQYLEFKREQASISKFEIREIESYINARRYKNIAEAIVNGNYEFSVPKKHLVNKINKSKKRVVYSFNTDENMILKLITYLFSKKYDNKYCDNCYSFRKKYGVKDAIKKLCGNKEIDNLYGYKVDIENYFNSVNVEVLLRKLKNFISDDDILYEFLKKILTNDEALFNDEIITECKGMIAGAPISSFLANIYLQDVDNYFAGENVLYARYSDDIIFFVKNEADLDKYIEKLNQLIDINGLKLNQSKVLYIKPQDKWDFLGFSYQSGTIDISDTAKKKIKGKIRRASKKLRRWMIRKNATSDRAISAVIRKFNKKFYMVENKNELTWQLWYFPIINNTAGLHEVDKYMQYCLRYIRTGKHNKRNYNLRYSDLKRFGYRPLVSEYYKFKGYNSQSITVE